MNIISQIVRLFGGNTYTTSSASIQSQSSSVSCEELLVKVQKLCSHLPEGKAQVIMGNGTFSVCVKWKPDSSKTSEAQEPALGFWLNGENEDVEYCELLEKTTDIQTSSSTSSKNVKIDIPDIVEEEEKPSKQMKTIVRLLGFLKQNYLFRYNILTDRTEYALPLIPNKADDSSHHIQYQLVDSRALNGISLAAMTRNIDCWDRDVRRYVESDNVPTYHPFTEYFKHLPKWDGEDRVTELARRVSDSPTWVNGFHRWMLAVTAQWMGLDAKTKRANSVAPILISTRQGLGKSTFCRNLLPEPLQQYFTESFDLSNPSSSENKLASFGLINLDEFDRISPNRMPQLKNLMQMERLNVRRAYRRSSEPLHRIASFIGTSNRRDLLTDRTGSRRFICVEITKPIDCTTPIDYDQLYAQLKTEINSGTRYWFSKAEEAEIQKANEPFYRITPAEEVLTGCFELAEPNELGAHFLSSASIYAILKQRNPSALQGYTAIKFSHLLAQIGRKVHTQYGNGYWVKTIDN